MVVAQLLLSAVEDDIPRVEEIRMAVKVWYFSSYLFTDSILHLLLLSFTCCVSFICRIFGMSGSLNFGRQWILSSRVVDLMLDWII